MAKFIVTHGLWTLEADGLERKATQRAIPSLIQDDPMKGGALLRAQVLPSVAQGGWGALPSLSTSADLELLWDLNT